MSDTKVYAPQIGAQGLLERRRKFSRHVPGRKEGSDPSVSGDTPPCRMTRVTLHKAPRSGRRTILKLTFWEFGTNPSTLE